MLRQITPNHCRLSINRHQRLYLASRPIDYNKQNTNRYVLKASSYSFCNSASNTRKTIFENQIQEAIFTYWMKIQTQKPNKTSTLQFLDKENNENLLEQTRVQENSNICRNKKQKSFRENFKLISQIHEQLGLKSQTFYLAITYLTALLQENSQFPVQFYSNESISITLLRIATKLEYGTRYKLSNFNKYSCQQLSSQMADFLEGQILKFFNFQMNKLTINSFLEFFKEKLDAKSPKIYFMANYLIELGLFYGILERYQIHIVFFGVVSIAQMIYKKSTQIRKFRQAIKIDGNRIVDLMAQVCRMIEGISCKQTAFSEHKFISAKYQKKERIQVANHLRDFRK